MRLPCSTPRISRKGSMLMVQVPMSQTVEVRVRSIIILKKTMSPSSVGAQTEWRDICLLFVAQSCPTLCDPMDCSTPGSSVLQCLLELAQIHVH